MPDEKPLPGTSPPRPPADWAAPGDTVDTTAEKGQPGTLRESKGGAESGKSIPRTVGPYEVLAELGRGGMGVVYKAVHPGLKRTVALKVLIAGEDASEEAIQRFHREAEAVAKLGHHPHIVPIYDIGQAGGSGGSPVHYFAMHLVEGTSLDRVIDEGALAPGRAAGIARKIADALRHAHEHGILHRDVKPANILLARLDSPDGAPRQSDSPDSKSGEAGNGGKARPASGGGKKSGSGSGRSGSRKAGSGESDIGEPMLTDFGLAKDVDTASKMTRSGMMLGTPNYMSPEQADGRHRDVDARSDVYSLGAALYEMLTGQPPFEGESVAQVVRKVLLDEPVSPARINRAVGRDLETICLKCLEKDPARRYASAADLSEDLRRHLAGEPIVARPVSLVERIARRARRNRAAFAALAALAAAAVAFAVAGTFLARGWREARDKGAEAEAGKAKTEEAARKSRQVTRVLMGAYTTLSDVQAELKKLRHDSGKSPEEKGRAYDRQRERVDGFVANFSSDPPAKAAALAVRGWLLWLAGREGEASASFGEAREADSEVAWSSLFEAMTWLSRYLAEQPWPRVNSGRDGLTFSEIPGETPAMREAREKFERLVGRIRDAGIWGEAAGEIGEVLAGFRGLQDQGLLGAEASLSKAIAVPELAWLEEDFRCVRARIRYLKSEFAKGLEDVDVVLSRNPGHLEALKVRGNLLAVRGIDEEFHGRDPVALYQDSIAAYTRVLEADPRFVKAFRSRAMVLLDLGEWESNHGADPRERFRKAGEDLEEAIRLDPADADSHANLANVRFRQGEWDARRGADPREALRACAEAAGEALRREPAHGPARNTLGLTAKVLAGWESDRGLDPRESYRKAVEAFSEILEKDPRDVAARSNRGGAWAGIGAWEQDHGFEPAEAFRRASEDAEEVVRLDSGSFEGRLAAGNAHRKAGESAFLHGRDPSEAMARAVEDFAAAEALDPSASSPRVQASAVHAVLANWDARQGRDPRDAYRKAVTEADEALKKNPEDFQAFLARAFAWRSLGEWEAGRGGDPRASLGKAVEDLEGALSRRPGDVNALNSFGIVRSLLGNFEMRNRRDPEEHFRKAVEAYDEVLRLSPGSLPARKNRANALITLGNARAGRGKDPAEAWRTALADLDEALRVNAGDTASRLMRGRLRFGFGQWEGNRGRDPSDWIRGSEEDLVQAGREDPGDSTAPLFRGRAGYFLAQWEAGHGKDPRETLGRAAEALAEAARADPKDAEASFTRGNVHLLWGGWESDGKLDPREALGRAAEDNAEAVRRNPSMITGWTNRGIALRSIGEWEAAHGMDPGPRFDGALEAFGGALSRKPDFWMALAHRSMTLEAMGRFAEAADDARKALAATGGKLAEAREMAARCEAAAAKAPWAEALERGRAELRSGEAAKAAETLGRALEAAGPASAAEDPFRTLLRLGRFHLARALARDPKRSTGALESLRESVALGFRDADRVRNGEEFALLKDLPAFRDLLSGMEGKR